ncbi:MAG: PIN domain-containing protein [Nitrospirales bacterium]|nr:MAG: PIN domain-containing protein [Nitrospirales bacterium]
MTLLDTHVLVWLVEGLPAIGKQAKKIADRALANDELSVSAISFWEIALLHQRGRLILGQPVDVWRAQLLEMGLHEVPIDGEVGIKATTMSNFHPDPTDRFITATAILSRASLVTADKQILQWPGNIKRVNAAR